jgi:hypothetical protein
MGFGADFFLSVLVQCIVDLIGILSKELTELQFA